MIERQSTGLKKMPDVSCTQTRLTVKRSRVMVEGLSIHGWAAATAKVLLALWRWLQQKAGIRSFASSILYVYTACETSKWWWKKMSVINKLKYTQCKTKNNIYNNALDTKKLWSLALPHMAKKQIKPEWVEGMEARAAHEHNIKFLLLNQATHTYILTLLIEICAFFTHWFWWWSN